MTTPTLALAKALIKCPSITPEDKGCQELLAQRLSAMGFEITHMPSGKVANLWARKGIATPLLCFAGHTDVVPPGNLNDWDSPPFTPTVRNGYLVGRGATDMKSSIAAMVTACERFFARHSQMKGSMAFLITSDEEGMAEDGTQTVLKTLHTSQQIPTWCLVGEASSTEKLGDTIKVGRRGSLTGTLTFIGQQGHVAYPHLAKNPIHLALKSLSQIANHVWDKGFGPFPPTTLQFSNIHAGTGVNNVIPGKLEAVFNLRFSTALTPETIKTTIEQWLNENACSYEIKWHQGGKPFYTDPKSSLIQVVSNTILNEMGYTPEHSTSGGTSDGRFFAEYGCEVVEVGPRNATAHKVNEHIEIDELEKLSILYEKILISLLV